MKKSIGPQDWMHRIDLPNTRAHVYRAEWGRTLCSLCVPDITKWRGPSTRLRCNSCLRRLENSKHWIHALLGENRE